MNRLAARKISAVLFYFALCTAIYFAALPGWAEAGMKAGAAERVITPVKPAYLAGYDQNRVSSAIHDDLYAHCLYLTDGSQEVTIISLDLLGLFINDVHAIRKLLEKRGFKPDTVFIASTHTHTAPDTLGLWGPNETVSGRDPSYIKRLYEVTTECAVAARDAAQPAEVGLAAGRIENVCHNLRDPDIQDNTATVMQFREPGGQVVATVVNYGCHPEVMLVTTAVSADFVSVLYKRLKEKTGGMAMFLNGALGGMVTPIVNADNWQEAERVGNLFTDQIEKIMGGLAWSRPDSIHYDTKTVLLSPQNEEFVLGMFSRLITRRLVKGKVATEIMHMQIGTAEFLSMPGEPLPKVGIALKALMRGEYKFLVSIGDDEIGYILPKEDFNPDRYEESASLGPDTAPALYEAAKELIREDSNSASTP